MAKEPVKIYGNPGLAGRVALFDRKANEHLEGQTTNPFSGGFDAGRKATLSKDHEEYGRPVRGSKTEFRGLKAGELISSEVKMLCDMVWEFGERKEEEGTAAISFRQLFEIYTHISNKVVGILMRARKHKLLHFEGEMLFQRRDDHVLIQLIKPIWEIRGEGNSPGDKA